MATPPKIFCHYTPKISKGNKIRYVVFGDVEHVSGI